MAGITGPPVPALGSHAHAYEGTTSESVGHTHRYRGMTGPAISTGLGHTHRIYGTTTYDHGHSHRYGLISRGPAPPR